MTPVTATVQLTPELMAEAFWELGSGEQAEFFVQLARAIKANFEEGNGSAYSLGERQWFYVGKELDKPSNKEGRDVLMALAAPHYLHTLRALEVRG